MIHSLIVFPPHSVLVSDLPGPCRNQRTRRKTGGEGNQGEGSKVELCCEVVLDLRARQRPDQRLLGLPQFQEQPTPFGDITTPQSLLLPSEYFRSLTQFLRTLNQRKTACYPTGGGLCMLCVWIQNGFIDVASRPMVLTFRCDVSSLSAGRLRRCRRPRKDGPRGAPGTAREARNRGSQRPARIRGQYLVGIRRLFHLPRLFCVWLYVS